MPRNPPAPAGVLSSRVLSPHWNRVDPSTETAPALPTRAPRPAAARLIGGISAAIAWLLCTLAAGAIAAFAALLAGIRPSWLLLILAIPLTVALRYCGCLRAPWAAAVAALAVLVAGFYAANLTAIARIAAATGFAFGAAFHTGGVGLTVQVAELGLDALAMAVYAAAAILAALVAMRLARR